ARLVVDLALLPDLPPVVHAARPAPVALADVLVAAGFTPPGATQAPASVTEMLHTDRWVNADLAWELVGRGPAEPLLDGADRAWYAAASAPPAARA
ncbi:MAG: hypothetical protein ACRCZP_04360, partial [Phycicoccus sp.]